MLSAVESKLSTGGRKLIVSQKLLTLQ